MHFEKIINLGKRETIKYLSSKFKEENGKSYTDDESLICSISKKGTIELHWKTCAIAEAIGAASINYDTNKYFIGKVIEVNENQSKIVLDFVDKTKKKQIFSLLICFPLISMLFIFMWYDVFLPERLFLFLSCSTLSTVIVFLLAFLSAKSSKEDYDFMDRFTDMVVNFIN